MSKSASIAWNALALGLDHQTFLAPHDLAPHDPIVRRVVTATSKFDMGANPVVINPHSMPVSP